jgi:hypothetical protein
MTFHTRRMQALKRRREVLVALLVLLLPVVVMLVSGALAYRRRVSYVLQLQQTAAAPLLA